MKKCGRMSSDRFARSGSGPGSIRERRLRLSYASGRSWTFLSDSAYVLQIADCQDMRRSIREIPPAVAKPEGRRLILSAPTKYNPARARRAASVLPEAFESRHAAPSLPCRCRGPSVLHSTRSGFSNGLTENLVGVFRQGPGGFWIRDCPRESRTGRPRPFAWVRCGGPRVRSGVEANGEGPVRNTGPRRMHPSLKRIE